MKTMKLTAIALVAIAFLLLSAGCTQPAGAPGTATPTQTVVSQVTVGILYTKGVGPMPTLLATKQIDGYIAWQPIVEVAPLAGIGKVVTYSQDLPPQGKWTNHPCCVFTARQDMIEKNPKIVDALSEVTILATQYTNDHPDESAEIVADWLAGKGNFTYGDISVSSVEVLKHAILTVKFNNTPSDDWKKGNIEFVGALRDLGTLSGSLKNATDEQAEAILFDTQPYENAKAAIASKQIITPPKADKQIGVGYLMSDHHAALFVAVKKWQYFNDTYGIAFKPQDPTKTKPDVVDLIVNGQKVAEIRLVPADAGPALMQLASTDTIQFAYVGNPPAISAIDRGTPIKILMAVNMEGSGVVVSKDSPANDWPGLVSWAQQRSDAGKPLVIAAPGKGSIQDVMLRYSLQDSGFAVKEVQV